jgi:hypothetical protein
VLDLARRYHASPITAGLGGGQSRLLKFLHHSLVTRLGLKPQGLALKPGALPLVGRLRAPAPGGV